MSNFNWVNFLRDRRLPFNERGPNTPHGAVTIHCPLCGDADPSDHMVLWPGGGWRCWRDHKHGGKHPAFLVRLLLGCSMLDAQRITNTAALPTQDRVQAVLEAARGNVQPLVQPKRTLKLPKEFRPLRTEWACWPYINYLRGRGFLEDPGLLNWRYGLYYAPRGPYAGRIVFPLVHNGDLISWTARTIYPAEELRYKTLTTDAEVARRAGLEPALAPMNHYLLWHDHCVQVASEPLGHKELVLVEGPLDALKVNMLGQWEPGVRVAGTCWTGSEPTAQQVNILRDLAPRFHARWVISDADMPAKAHTIAARLRSLDFRVAVLPRKLKDPAELRSVAQLLAVLR